MANFSLRDLSLAVEGLRNPAWRQGLGSNVGTMFKRYMMTGRCTTCNNLRSDNHEDGVNVSRGFWDYHLDHNDRADAVRERAVAEAGSLLQLEDVPMKDILKCRIKDGKGRFLSECRYCRFICDIVDEVFPYHAAVWEARCERGTMRGTVTLFIHPGRPLVLRCRGDNFEVDSLNDRYFVDIELYHDDYSSSSLSPSEAGQGSTSEEDATLKAKRAELLPHVGSAKRIPPSSDDVESQEFIATQFQRCLAKHSACRPTGPKPVREMTEGREFVPTRLLRVTDDRVRIIESKTEDAESNAPISWIALSHCWGGSKIITLKQDSLEVMKGGIDWADLPPTFQNAINVTRRLGIDYIWIDSLCIVQDDAADWEREAADMGAVYGYATLVVSASSSWNPYEPFLRERDAKWSSKTVHFKPADGEPVPFQIRRRVIPATRLDQGPNEPPYTSDWATLQRPGPLYRRSWTFQEAFLAVRAVQFNPGGLVFECKTHRALEGALPPYPNTTEDTLGEFTTAQKWRMIVKAYSPRDLTFAKDRLPAIAGIAAMISQQTGDKYVAGLWASTLISDLMWHAMPGAQRLGTAFPYRPYIAPSWSWASIRCGVVWTPFPDFTPLASIDEYHTVPSAPDSPFGQIRLGVMLVRGRTLRCRVRWDSNGSEYVAYFKKANGRNSTERWFLPDSWLLAAELPVPSESNEASSSTASAAPPVTDVRRARVGEACDIRALDTEATFLCIGKTPRLAHDHVGLILGKGYWPKDLYEFRPMQRVGAVTNLPQEWYDAAEESVTMLW